MLNKNVLKTISRGPGIYFYKDGFGKIIYVGKAKDLKERLSYYFQKDLLVGKTQDLMFRAQSLEVTQTLSEADALLLEAHYIKKFKPKYNIALKDDKSSLYVKIENRRDLSGFRFPAITFARKNEEKEADYFGPYPNGSSIKAILKIIRKIYLYRDCTEAKFRKYEKLGHGCLFYDLKLCGGPCAGLIGQNEYLQNIKKIKYFLGGHSSKLTKNLRLEMRSKAANLEFEEAAQLKTKLNLIEKINQIKFSPSDYQQNPNLTRETRREEVNDAINLYNQAPGKTKISRFNDFRIEAYDISNTSGNQATGSMVANVDGEMTRDDYRKFKIKKSETPNDYLMLKEILERRFRHPDWTFPQLILIDGGLAQVAIAEKVLDEINISIPVIGLAKRLERPAINGKYFYLGKSHPSLNLFKRVRDEAHRFAKSYHKLLRLNKLFS